MASIDAMEKQLAELKDRQAKIRKELSAAKRQKTAKENAQRRAKEQAESVAFVKKCKTVKLKDGRTVYEWAMKALESKS